MKTYRADTKHGHIAELDIEISDVHPDTILHGVCVQSIPVLKDCTERTEDKNEESDSDDDSEDDLRDKMTGDGFEVDRLMEVNLEAGAEKKEKDMDCKNM